MPLPVADSAALDVAIYLMFSEDSPVVVVENKGKSKDKNNWSVAIIVASVAGQVYEKALL